ncbi:MAG TPA: sugar ABC transporter permease [Methylomirabilota bacterium]|nr:sugar ABC transporter permease [Methylomirabilota bacterium]
MTSPGVRAAAQPAARPRVARRRERTATGLAATFLAPTLISLAAFTYWPLVRSVLGSFERWSLAAPGYAWVGLDNYAALLRDQLFRHVLANTALYVVIEVPLAVLVGLLAAIAVNGSGRLRLLARALIFHPVLLPTVAVAAIWLFLLNPVSGPVADLVSRLSGSAPNVLGGPLSALVTVAVVAAYKNCGLYMLFFLAGLQAIPRELEDAARVEGATEWRVFRHVTWPLLGPVALYVLITAVLDGLRNVDHIFVLTRGGPANATNVLLYETYLKAFEFWDIGRASALTVMLVAVLLAVAALAMPRLERGVHYEA